MDEHGIDTYRLEKNDIAQEIIDDLLVFHRGAAVFDDEGLAAIFLDVGQRLDEAFGAGFWCGEHVLFAEIQTHILFSEIGGPNIVGALTEFEIDRDLE